MRRREDTPVGIIGTLIGVPLAIGAGVLLVLLLFDLVAGTGILLS
jgi:hypothetical protein